MHKLYPLWSNFDQLDTNFCATQPCKRWAAYMLAPHRTMIASCRPLLHFWLQVVKIGDRPLRMGRGREDEALVAVQNLKPGR